MQFGDMLRRAMDEAGLTQLQLADRSGIPQATISRYLRKQIKPGVDKLDALERALPELREIRREASAA
jgi:transcriptional regulator with XRE-family HTH domain